MSGCGWTLLVSGAVWLLLSYNAIRPHHSRPLVAAVSFFAGWLRAELALHVVLFEVLLLGVLVWNGALRTVQGGIGALFYAASITLMLSSLQSAFVSRDVVDRALAGLDRDDVAPTKLPWRVLLIPFWTRDRTIERIVNRVNHDDGSVRLALDVYRPRDAAAATPRPALVFVHGGAWMIGSKRFQGLPLISELARRGWVCFSINYRLSPKATFPDHLVDVKRAIAWVRAHAAEHGCDPRFVVVAGNSAGGHLASLAALTPNVAALQPGFERADTSVAACVSLYGVYDFTDRFAHWHNRALQRLLERFVMKATLADAPRRFAAASPLEHVGAQAPPFLVVHGDCDSLVPVAEARAFVDALRRGTRATCAYLEVPGAQHAFEVFPSVRTAHLLRGVARFAAHVHRRHLAAIREADSGVRDELQPST